MNSGVILFELSLAPATILLIFKIEIKHMLIEYFTYSCIICSNVLKTFCVSWVSFLWPCYDPEDKSRVLTKLAITSGVAGRTVTCIPVVTIMACPA